MPNVQHRASGSWSVVGSCYSAIRPTAYRSYSRSNLYIVAVVGSLPRAECRRYTFASTLRDAPSRSRLPATGDVGTSIGQPAFVAAAATPGSGSHSGDKAGMWSSAIGRPNAPKPMPLTDAHHPGLSHYPTPRSLSRSHHHREFECPEVVTQRANSRRRSDELSE